MARLSRILLLKRKVLLLIAIFITIFLVVSEFTTPLEPPLSLDDDYDPALFRAKNTSSSGILIVSALFFIPEYKSSNETILSYLSLFLGPITTDTYIYTTPELAPLVEAVRGTDLPITIDTSFGSPFEVPPLRGRETVYKQMHDIDKERTFRVPELYAVWNAKPYFVENAIRTLRGMREYDYVFWNDADSFKEDHAYSAWPDIGRLEKVWEEGSIISGSKKQDLIFMPVINPPSKDDKFWTEDMGPIDVDFSEGSFFGGPPDSMKWFSRTFYSYHDHFLKLGFFSGKDNTIYNSLMLLFPSHFITVWVSDPTAPTHSRLPPMLTGHGHLGACGEERYYYQWWLSDRDTREKMRHWWAANDHDPDAVSWWRTKVSCRSTRVLGIEGVLQRTFGDKWTVPSNTISKPSRTW